MKYKNIPKELLERFATTEFDNDLHILTIEIRDRFRKQIEVVEKMMTRGFDAEEVDKAIMLIRTNRTFLNKLSTLFGAVDKLTDEEIKENRGRILDAGLVSEDALDVVNQIIENRSASTEKAGTREGALKAWKTRRRSLLDKLRDAISNRDAKAVVRLKQQLASGAKIAQEVYGKEE